MPKGVKYQCREGIKYYSLWKFDAQELIDNFEAWKQNRQEEDPAFKILDEGSRVRLCRKMIQESDCRMSR